MPHSPTPPPHSAAPGPTTHPPAPPRPAARRAGAAQGVGAGDHVALYLHNGTEYLEGMLAAFKLRAVPINVNYRYGEDELRYLLDDADARAVVYHREFAPALRAIRAELPSLDAFVEVADNSGAQSLDG